MRLPMICLDEQLAQFLSQFRDCFSKPQYRYFVIIRLGLMLNYGSGTLSGLLRQVEGSASLSGVSRFFASAPWSAEQVSQCWQGQFRVAMGPAVQAEHRRQRAKGRKKRGRPKKTVVTGYLIGDDSVMEKRRGKQMGGLGQHYCSSAEKTVTGHCLVQGLYVLLGRRCPLSPKLYRQKRVCEAEGVPFLSKIELMIQTIMTFEPVPGTQTHILLDSWYTAKKIWQAARARGFLITSGLRSNRNLRIDDPTTDKGWRWQALDDYARRLTDEDFTSLDWPNQQQRPRTVYVHVISTRVKKLYRCQVICIRETLDGKTKFWASTDLDADLETLVTHIATRWDIEVLFADTKELFGLDHYQLMTAKAIVRFWTLGMLAYCFLDQQRAQIQLASQRHTTIGDAWRQTQHTHWAHFIHWLFDSFTQNGATPEEVIPVLVA